MASEPDSVLPGGLLHEQPQQNQGCQVVGISTPELEHDLSTTNSAESASLIHPESLGVHPLDGDIDQHLCQIFSDAALQFSALRHTIMNTSFSDMSWGLLFAMFAKGDAKCTKSALAQEIILRNSCFEGTIYRADAGGARLLSQAYASRSGGSTFKGKKHLWKINSQRGAGWSKELLQWLTGSIFAVKRAPADQIHQLLSLSPNPGGSATNYASSLSLGTTQALLMNAESTRTPPPDESTESVRPVNAQVKPGVGQPQGRAAKTRALKVLKAQAKMTRAERNIAATEPHSPSPVYAEQKRHTIQVRNSRGTRFVERTVHNIEMLDSQITGAGKGCLAKEDILRTGIVTGYGGEVLTDRDEAIRRRDAHSDSHIQSACSIFWGQFLDSRVRGQFTLDYYAVHGLLGGTVNDHGGARDKSLKPNVKVLEVEEYWEHPYSPDARVTTSVFYVALRDIKAGEEIICSYGKHFSILHMDTIEEGQEKEEEEGQEKEKEGEEEEAQPRPKVQLRNAGTQVCRAPLAQECTNCTSKARELGAAKGNAAQSHNEVVKLRQELLACKLELAGANAAWPVFEAAVKTCDIVTGYPSKYYYEYGDHGKNV